MPLAPEQVYKAAFPESKFAQWLFDPVPTDLRRHSLPYRNMVACTHREGIVHFVLNSQTEMDAMHDDDAVARFWIRFQRHVAAPPTTGCFMLAEEVRCDRALVDWYNAALQLDEEIWHFTQKIYKAVANVRNASEFALAWPEVVNAVPGLVDPLAVKRAAARSPRIPVLRKEVLAYFPPTEMARVTDMLATAIMLPPVTMPTAWVGLHDPGMEDSL
jgi:hypothetical protein